MVGRRLVPRMLGELPQPANRKGASESQRTLAPVVATREVSAGSRQVEKRSSRTLATVVRGHLLLLAASARKLRREPLLVANMAILTVATLPSC